MFCLLLAWTICWTNSCIARFFPSNPATKGYPVTCWLICLKYGQQLRFFPFSAEKGVTLMFCLLLAWTICWTNSCIARFFPSNPATKGYPVTCWLICLKYGQQLRFFPCTTWKISFLLALTGCWTSSWIPMISNQSQVTHSVKGLRCQPFTFPLLSSW